MMHSTMKWIGNNTINNMSIKFNYKEETEEVTLRLSDVLVDQFFVTRAGGLAQKVAYRSFNLIADANGSPCAGFYENEPETTVIKKILPEVVKIEF